MEGCGLTCVLFIWLAFLWPIIITVVFLQFKGINKKGKFFIVNTLVGYAVYGIASTVYSYFVGAIHDSGFIDKNVMNIDLLSALFTTIGFAIIFIPPVISGYYVYKKYS